jgi:hypothetical protein
VLLFTPLVANATFPCQGKEARTTGLHLLAQIRLSCGPLRRTIPTEEKLCMKYIPRHLPGYFCEEQVSAVIHTPCR